MKATFGAIDPAVGAQQGQWSQVLTDWTALAIHATLLPDGQVLTFGGNYYPDWQDYAGKVNVQYLNKMDLWDPVTGTHTNLSYTGSALFCGGHVVLPDGRLLVTGGDDLSKLTDSFSKTAGTNETHIYDYKSRTWTRGANMTDKRWYPTSTVLPSGEVLTIAGNKTENGVISTLPEVYNPGTNTWRPLSNAQHRTELYPWMFVLSDGRVINVGGGDNRSTGIYTTDGTGSFTPFDREGNRFRDYGSAVMYAPDKILVVGGGGDANPNFNPQYQLPTNTALTVDVSSGTPKVQATGSMKYGRRQAVATLLPDGSVLETGGTGGLGFTNNATAVYAAELWNPDTGQWQTLSSMTQKRVYHSTALLLPDATVLVSGGGSCRECPGAANGDAYAGYNTWKNAEIFKPPYLFKGARPSIKTLSTATPGYNQTLQIGADEAAGIDKVTLIRLGSVTHAFNMNQRINVLPITQKGNATVTVQMPANANLAPPGHYMLFILRNGVPSVSRIVQLH